MVYLVEEYFKFNQSNQNNFFEANDSSHNELGHLVAVNKTLIDSCSVGDINTGAHHIEKTTRLASLSLRNEIKTSKLNKFKSLDSEENYEENIDDFFTLSSSCSTRTISSSFGLDSCQSALASASASIQSSKSSSNRESIENASNERLAIEEEELYFAMEHESNANINQQQLYFASESQQSSMINRILNEINGKLVCNSSCRDQEKPQVISDDLKTSKTFWMYLLNSMGLSTILYSTSKLDNELTESFMGKLNKLIVCLNKVEKELENYLKNLDEQCHYSFSIEFFLKLSFFLYEQTEALSNLNKSDSTDLCYSVSIQSSDFLNSSSLLLFESYLNFLLEKYVSKYLSILIDNQKSYHLDEKAIGSGQSIVDFFKRLFRFELFVKQDEEQSPSEPFNDFKREPECCQICEKFVDVSHMLSKPLISVNSNEFILKNPITQGYKMLIDNLNSLNYQTHDPFSAADEEAAKYGTECNNISFACLSLSYYSMGLFEIKRNLFDNPYQYLYELKQFEDEYRRVFSSAESSKQTTESSFKSSNNTFKNQKGNLKQSKWKIENTNENQLTKKQNESQREEKIEKPKQLSVYEEIIERISNLNNASIFDSYFKTLKQSGLSLKDLISNASCNACDTIQQNQYMFQDVGKCDTSNSNSNRIWTVAPKLLSSNTTSSCSKRTPSNVLSPINFFESNNSCVSMNNYENGFDLNETANNRSNQWLKGDPRPIGTKPASMLSNNRYRHSNKYLSYSMSKLNNTNSQLPQNVANAQAIDANNVWKEKSEKTATSPFIAFHYSINSNDVNEFIKSARMLKPPAIDSNAQKSGNVKIMKDGAQHGHDHIIRNVNSIGKSSSVETKIGKYSVAPISMINNKKLNNEQYGKSAKSSSISSLCSNANINKMNTVNNNNITNYNTSNSSNSSTNTNGYYSYNKNGIYRNDSAEALENSFKHTSQNGALQSSSYNSSQFYYPNTSPASKSKLSSKLYLDNHSNTSSAFGNNVNIASANLINTKQIFMRSNSYVGDDYSFDYSSTSNNPNFNNQQRSGYPSNTNSNQNYKKQTSFYDKFGNDDNEYRSYRHGKCVYYGNSGNTSGGGGGNGAHNLNNGSSNYYFKNRKY